MLALKYPTEMVSIYKDKQTRTRTQTQRSRLWTESQPREVSIFGVQHMSIRNQCKDSKTIRNQCKGFFLNLSFL